MTGFWQRTRLLTFLFRRWGLILLDKSYWHVPQEVGTRFVPGELAGYFNDLTAKVAWKGPIDEHGLPVQEFGGRRLYFPTTIFQKALGHWDYWLISADDVHRLAFLKIAEWTIENQDEAGGWPIWTLLGLAYPSPYSAMTQGEGVSVLVRAYKLTQEPVFLEAARKSLELLKKPISEGGTCREVPEGVILEEVPHVGHKAILNGWIFALFGLYDYTLVEKNSEILHLMSRSLDALEAYLPRYDAGYWSYYDLSGHLASPFYHRLHIAQLQALSFAFPDRADKFREIKAKFRQQLRSPLARLKALTIKAIQKLGSPPEVPLE